MKILVLLLVILVPVLTGLPLGSGMAGMGDCPACLSRGIAGLATCVALLGLSGAAALALVGRVRPGPFLVPETLRADPPLRPPRSR